MSVIVKTSDIVDVVEKIGDLGGRVFPSSISTNTKYAMEKIAKLEELGLVRRVRVGKRRVYELTEKGLRVYGLIREIRGIVRGEGPPRGEEPVFIRSNPWLKALGEG